MSSSFFLLYTWQCHAALANYFYHCLFSSSFHFVPLIHANGILLLRLCQFSFLSTAWFHTSLPGFFVNLSSWKFSTPQSKQAECQIISSWLSQFQTPLQQMSSSDAWLWTVGLQEMHAWMPYQINSKVTVVTNCTVN